MRLFIFSNVSFSLTAGFSGLVQIVKALFYNPVRIFLQGAALAAVIISGFGATFAYADVLPSSQAHASFFKVQVGSAIPSLAAQSQTSQAPLVTGDEGRLDALYEQLRLAPSAEKAAGISKSIEAFWQHQGGSAANLLSDRAVLFARKGEMEKAITLMDQVVQVQPGFAEGWRRRAQFYMQRSNPVRAMMDLQETLKQEPRHYQAWVALGSVLEANNDSYRALAAYRRALGLYPHMQGLSDKVLTLSATVRGYTL